MDSFLIFFAVVVGLCLIMFATVMGFRKPDKKGIEQLGSRSFASLRMTSVDGLD